jgi:hypothetical protein
LKISSCKESSNTGIYIFSICVLFKIESISHRDSKNNFVVSSPGANQTAGISSFINIFDNQLYLHPPNKALLLSGWVSNISKTTPS